ncbi:hypothetical protein AB0E69_35520 [Kribbella sp. NPDC026611]|uniref:hypothetical protein n=1 Tax=Kribbella sp. NPDC026611 TaxID=3154911 RepID=UPI0034088C84
MVKSVVALADRLVTRIVPTVDSHAACLSCSSGCLWKCCTQGARASFYRCCINALGNCECVQLYPDC